MALNLIAILLSFAMMLTGAGEAGEPAQARSLVLHDVVLTRGGETVELAPSVRLGAATDGESAVFDFAVELNGETLLPIQLGVSEAGLIATVVNSGEAVGVTAEALESALEENGVSLDLASLAAQSGDDETASFIVGELLPAYASLIEAVQDEDFQARVQASADALFAEMIDRGEGTPVSEEIGGETVELTQYTYTVEGDKLAELADALYAGTPELADYYNAVLKLYAMLPEESGLNGVTSFSEVLEKSGVALAMNVVEELSDDGTVDITDAAMSIDVNGIVAAQMAELPEDETPEEIPELPPLVMDIHSSEVGEDKYSEVTFNYDFDEASVSFAVNASELPGSESGNMSLFVSEEGVPVLNLAMSMSSVTDDVSGETSYAANFSFSAAETQGNFSATGTKNADGTSANDVSVSGESNGESFALSFGLDVVGDAIEDVVNGSEAQMIDDLSEEGLSALGENESFLGTVMKLSGALTVDAGKLMGDESVQQAAVLLNGGDEPEDEPYDYTYDIEDADDAEALGIEFEDDGEDGFTYEIESIEYDDDDAEGDYTYEEPEDDGVLNFEIPTFGWLPEGWDVLETNADTAYDWADVTLGDESGENNAYALFFVDDESNQVNYIVSEDGDIAPVEGREVTVSDFGEGSVSVTMRVEDMYVNMMFNSEGIDLETIGQIVAGLQF